MPEEDTLSAGSPDWPRALDDLCDPPPRLRVRGRVPPLDRAVAIVGTRRADDEGCAFARTLARDLSAAGCVVVSGGARGIDAAAHRGALDAGHPTVAVLATGFEPPYPTAHRSLFDAIVQSGALLSEAEDGRAPRPGWFLQRNRLIAALARVVVVVQAPRRSGALSTAAQARKLGRTLMAVPSAPWDPRATGCLRLLGGDGTLICTRARDVLSVAALGSSERGTNAQKSGNLFDLAHLDADGLAVWAQIGPRARHVDEVARRARLPASRVQRALVELMIHGLVVPRGGGRYARAPQGP